jgi:hypothetical protein
MADHCDQVTRAVRSNRDDLGGTVWFGTDLLGFPSEELYRGAF